MHGALKQFWSDGLSDSTDDSCWGWKDCWVRVPSLHCIATVVWMDKTVRLITAVFVGFCQLPHLVYCC